MDSDSKIEKSLKKSVDNMYNGISLFPKDQSPPQIGRGLENFHRKTREHISKAGWPSL